MARSRSETASAVSLNSTIAPTASLRFTIGATIAERSGQSRPSQPCFQPTGRRETRRSIIASTAPGGAASPAPWWSAPRPACASTRSRSHTETAA